MYSWDWPSLLDSPQKSPLVTEPWTSSSADDLARCRRVAVLAALELDVEAGGAAVDGNVNRPIELCVVAVNSDVMASDPLLCAE